MISKKWNKTGFAQKRIRSTTCR